MNCKEFENNAIIKNNSKFIQHNDTYYIAPVNENEDTFVGKLIVPKMLKIYKNQAYWEIGPSGKYLHINNIRIKL